MVYFWTCPHRISQKKVKALEKYLEKVVTAIGNEKLKKVMEKNFPEINEIRVTVNKPICIIINRKSFFIDNIPISPTDMENIFFALCEYSVHAYKNEICEGFITCEGGVRVGICGTAVYSDDKIYTVKDISALNIRIPHEIKEVSKPIRNCFGAGGILVIGPPCSGKTTVLRDIAQSASEKFFVTIVDERMEIAGVFNGCPAFDIGNSTVLNGFIKSDGIKSAVRSMSPDIIICDEFGDEKDIKSALFAMKSGAQIVASMHAYDKEDFLLKPIVKELITTGIFSIFAFLDRSHQIYEILTSKELAL